MAKPGYPMREVVQAARGKGVAIERGTTLAELAQASGVSARPDAPPPSGRRTLAGPDARADGRGMLDAAKVLALAIEAGLCEAGAVEAGISADRFAGIADRLVDMRGQFRKNRDRRDAGARMKAAKAGAKRALAAGNATPETVAKCRRDQVLAWVERGHLNRSHQTAAEEIHDIWLAMIQAQFPAASQPGAAGGGARSARLVMDPVLGQPTHSSALDRMDPTTMRRYREVYLPWARSLRETPVTRVGGRDRREVEYPEALDMTLSLVVDNRPVTAIKAAFGFTGNHPVVQEVIRATLQRYVEMGGLEGGLKRRV